jgi:hypothetical protein
MSAPALAEWLNDFAAGIAAGFIGGAIFVACYRPAGAVMILRWMLS